MDKLPLEIKRLTATYFLSTIGVALILSLAFFKLVFMQAWTPYHYIIFIGYALAVILFYIYTLKTNYYQINNSSIICKKYTKEYEFTYKDIVYIDQEKSLKKRKLIFYGVKAKERYLPFDKDGLIYKAAIKNCKNLLSKDEFKRLYPNSLL